MRRWSAERRICAWVASAGALLLGVVAVPARAADAGQLDGWREKALDLVNVARREHGLSVLTRGSALESAAQSHAEDMLRRHYYSHTSPDGDDVADRFTTAGGSRWEIVEENIARCADCRPPVTAETVSRLQTGWMNSPHHRENILREGLARFGYGIVDDGERGLYAVQTFAGPGTPRGANADEPPKALSDGQAAGAVVELLNRTRHAHDHGAVEGSEALDAVARSLLPDPASETVSLRTGGSLFDKLPANDRARWSSLRVLEAACGGCGTEPTDADLRFFRRQWLGRAENRDALLAADVTHAGFALQAIGNGRKVAVLVLGTAR